MKKKIIILLTYLLIVTLLGACSSKISNDDKPIKAILLMPVGIVYAFITQWQLTSEEWLITLTVRIFQEPHL